MDHYSAHKAPEVQKWLARHQRFQSIVSLPVLPGWTWSNASFVFWRWSHPTGVFHSVAELQKAIRDYIDEDNRNPRPYLWTAKARDIKAGSSPPWKASTAGWYWKPIWRTTLASYRPAM